ncbi:MAG: ABC transporter substrate-binding protein [Pseudomonadota bacterium]
MMGSSRARRTGRWTAVALGCMTLLSTQAMAQNLRIGLGSDPDALDPTLSRTVAGRVVFASLCDKLIDIDEKLNYVPQLATSWEWSPDGKTLTMKLRPGVKFHDGETFDAAAAKASLDRHFAMPGSNRKNELGPLDSVEVIDDSTIALKLKSPFAPLIAALSDRAGMMMSPKAIAAGTFSNKPVCAGPFKFAERVAQERIVLERFPEYWDATNVFFDKVTFLPIPDAPVRVANLRSGSLDLIEAVPATDIPVLQQSKLVVAKGQGLASTYIAINVGDTKRSKTPIMTNPKLREALELAIDRNVLNQAAFEGVNTPGNQSVPPGSPYYAKSVPMPGRDVAKAKALIKEAGLQRLKVEMLVPNSSTFTGPAQILQAMVAEADIDLQLVVMETTTLLKEWTNGNFETLLILWSGRTDIDGNLYAFNACDGTLNGGKYCSKEVDALLNAGRTSNDVATRYAAYEKAAALYLADRPYIYLWHPTLIYGLSPKIEGFKVVPDGLARVTGVKMKK